MKVKLTTSMGPITIELDEAKAPVSAENFLKYVDSGHYNGTIFHRVIDGFMIQGGGFTKDMKQKPTQPPIKNESANGLKNDDYTVAMARTGVRDSATSQFFINVKHNDFLNYARPGRWATPCSARWSRARTWSTRSRRSPRQRGGHQNVPTTPVVIEKAERV